MDKDHSAFSVDVNVSLQFYAWIFGLGPKVKLVGPADVVKEFKAHIKDCLKNY